MGQIRKRLRQWYRRNRRDLPWRRTRDPYRVWISEIMLQQTRVAAVIPYYERFLERFPDVESLARAPEADLLAAWSGLGYYSRARNLKKAAGQIAAGGGFPREHKEILKLAGIGDYTAAAVASIAFDLPHAVLDGNVSRVLSRLTNDAGEVASAVTRRRLKLGAQQLLDSSAPGEFNQAVMELGATVCLPKQPQCDSCPVGGFCEARSSGTERQLPVKRRPEEIHRIDRIVFVIKRRDRLLLWQRPPDSPKLAGFWELPEPEGLPAAIAGEAIGGFRHSITNHEYRFEVVLASIRRKPAGFGWFARDSLKSMPLSTTARKAIAIYRKATERSKDI